jgi:DNA-directed RNA polymerase subunit RPC12/RpoP
MAQGRLFRCTNCKFRVGAWSDAKAYYLSERGRKKYAYHPNHELLARCVGFDVPHLCLECGTIFDIDSQKPSSTCRTCTSTRIVDCYLADGCKCPKCKQGTLKEDPKGRAIS